MNVILSESRRLITRSMVTDKGVGELIEVVRKGYPNFLAIAGSHFLFHAPTDDAKAELLEDITLALKRFIERQTQPRANVPIPASMQGIDLLGTPPGRTDFFYEHTFMGSPRLPKVEGVVSRQWKYMKFIEHNYEELYDTAHDPHETTNLAQNARYSAELRKMRKRYQSLKQAVQ